MASTITNTVRLKTLYGDGGERTYTFDEVSNDALSSVKAKVMAMNAELADSESSIGAALKATFVNDDNDDNILAPLVKIASANYTSTETEVIYDGQ